MAQSICQILRRSNHVSTVIAGGQDTVGLQVPNHPAEHGSDYIFHDIYRT
jgi:hypothetical protein